MPHKKKLYISTLSLILLCILYLAVNFFKFEYSWTINDHIIIDIYLILDTCMIIASAFWIDWILNHFFIENYYKNREIEPSYVSQPVVTENPKKTQGSHLIKYLVLLYGTQLLIKRFSLDLLLFQRDIKGEIIKIYLSDLFMALTIIFMARIIVWFMTQVTFYRMYKKKHIDEGSQYALNQIFTYVIYVIAFIMALDRIVTDMKLIYGGAAALLVGIGLGLQQTFNDFFSGLVLLFERSVKVGDILEVDGEVGRVLKIGLRASLVETRNNVSMLVPNSKLVNQSVINWTHFNDIVRFKVDVGVAYGSDTHLVKSILLQVAKAHDKIEKKPEPFVRFVDFGDSALVFSLFFFSKYVMPIEDTKSDLRFEIDQLFRKHNIIIPFPQRDIWIKKE